MTKHVRRFVTRSCTRYAPRSPSLANERDYPGCNNFSVCPVSKRLMYANAIIKNHRRFLHTPHATVSKNKKIYHILSHMNTTDSTCVLNRKLPVNRNAMKIQQ